MRIIIWNILDIIAKYGEEYTNIVLSDFSNSVEIDGNFKHLNPDIENFLKKNAIQFSKEKKSITYLVLDRDSGHILGFFTLTHKAVEIPAEGLSRSAIRKIEKNARLDREKNVFVLSAFLIAQFGKNYAVEADQRISGQELIDLCSRELSEIRYRIGGNVVYLDCEPDANLIRFYQAQQQFTLFGERTSETDGKRYLQYMKFIRS